ncbi:MAG: hypothetical protein O3A00_07515 [Planctomycetota bacterium]|nr:hypothetical protein [Planctomycetota bacterium]
MHTSGTLPATRGWIHGFALSAFGLLVIATLAFNLGCGSKTATDSVDTSESKSAGESITTKTSDKTALSTGGNPVPPAPTSIETVNIDHAFDLITDDSFAAVVIRPQQILGSEFVKAGLVSVPGFLDAEKANFKTSTGIDPDTIGAVVVMAWPGANILESKPRRLDVPKLPELPGGLDSPGCQDDPKVDNAPKDLDDAEEHLAITGGAVLVLTKAVSIESLGVDDEAHEFNGRKYFSNDELAYSLINSTTIVFAEVNGIEKILAAKGNSPIAKQLRTLNLDGPITLTIRREQAAALVDIVPILPEIKSILTAIDDITVQGGLDKELAISAVVNATGTELPPQLKQIAEAQVAEMKDAAPQILGPLATGLSGNEFAKKAIDMALAVLNSATFLADGKRFEAKLRLPEGSGETLRSLLFDSGEDLPPVPADGPKLPPAPARGPTLPPEPNPIKGLD